MAKNGLEYLKAVAERKARIAKVNARRGGRSLYELDNRGYISRGTEGREADPGKRVYKGGKLAVTNQQDDPPKPSRNSRFGRLLDDMDATQKEDIQNTSNILDATAKAISIAEKARGQKLIDRDKEIELPEIDTTPTPKRKFSDLITDLDDINQADIKNAAKMYGAAAKATAIADKVVQGMDDQPKDGKAVKQQKPKALGAAKTKTKTTAKTQAPPKSGRIPKKDKKINPEIENLIDVASTAKPDELIKRLNIEADYQQQVEAEKRGWTMFSTESALQDAAEINILSRYETSDVDAVFTGADIRFFDSVDELIDAQVKANRWNGNGKTAKKQDKQNDSSPKDDDNILSMDDLLDATLDDDNQPDNDESLGSNLFPANWTEKQKRSAAKSQILKEIGLESDVLKKLNKPRTPERREQQNIANGNAYLQSPLWPIIEQYGYVTGNNKEKMILLFSIDATSAKSHILYEKGEMSLETLVNSMYQGRKRRKDNEEKAKQEESAKRKSEQQRQERESEQRWQQQQQQRQQQKEKGTRRTIHVTYGEAFFDKPETLKDLKRQYRQLSKKHHPDLGGDAKKFIAMNNEYERLKKSFPDSFAERHFPVKHHRSPITSHRQRIQKMREISRKYGH